MTMKNMMNKFWNLLAENIALLALIAGVGIGAFLLFWRYSVTGYLKKTTSVDYASWKYWKDADRVGDQMLVRDQEIYLLDEYTGEILAGPYAWIIVDDFGFSEGRALATDQEENQYEIDTDGLKIL